MSLNGFNQTVAGLVSEGTADRVIKNDAATLATLTVDNASTAYTFGGTLIGNLALIKAGAGTLTLSGDNSYAGQTRVDAGVLRIEHPDALGNTAAGTVVADGAALEVDHAGTVAEPVTIFGPGINWNGALSNRAGVNTWTGPVTLGGSLARVGAVAGTLHVAGGVDGSGGNHAFVSATTGGAQVIYDSVIRTGWGSWIIHGSGTTTLNQPALIGNLTIDLEQDGFGTGNDYEFRAEEADKFFRYFGDSDGDRDLDASDSLRLRNSYGQTAGSSRYLWYFDYDQDGDVDADDRSQFLARYRTSLAWTP